MHLTRKAFAVAMIVTWPAGLSGHVAQAQSRVVEYYNPSWSPDSKSLVFESTRDGKFSIYRVTRDGSSLTRLTVDTVNNEQPDWSPDGRHLAFISDRDGHSEIYVMDSDGSHQRRLTHTADGGFFEPRYSPVDRWIAFSGHPGSNRNIELLFVVHPDGTGLRQLTDSSNNSVGPFWSSNGQWLVFTQNPYAPFPRGSPRAVVQTFMRTRDATHEIAIIRPDGSGFMRLTHNDVDDCCAQWTGNALVFFSARDSAKAVYSMSSTGSDIRRLVANAHSPVPAPNGRALYAIVTRDSSSAITAFNSDGSNARRIGDANGTSHHVVSPDGRYMAYAKSRNGDAGIFVLDLASGVERRVAGASP